MRSPILRVGLALSWLASMPAAGPAAARPDTTSAVRAGQVDPVPATPESVVDPTRPAVDRAPTPWRRIDPYNLTRREQHSVIVDAPGKRLVMFGGENGDATSGDVWTRPTTGATGWTLVVASGGPSARARHVAVFDPRRRRMLVFGGMTSLRGPLANDTWALDLSGTPTWHEISPGGALPPARELAAAVYDPVRDRLIVFGGYAGGTLNDVWALTLSGTPEWTHIIPAQGLDAQAPAGNPDLIINIDDPPYPREGSVAVYDPIGDRMIVIGGFTGSRVLNDVWALRLSPDPPRWQELTPPGDTGFNARFFTSAVYDTARGLVMVAGGSGDPLLPFVWELTLRTTTSSLQLATVGPMHVARSGQTASIVTEDDRILYFGGYDGTYHDDTWSLSLAGPKWSQLEPDRPDPLSGRYAPAVVFDAPRDRMIVHGGADYVYGECGEETRLWGDVWSLSLGPRPEWSLIQPSGTPPTARVEHAAALDPVRQRMIVFAGWDGTFRNDLWALSLAGQPAWSPIQAEGTPPVGRDAMALVYDAKRDRMLMFGGFDGQNFLGDLWALELSGTPRWTEIAVSGAAPVPRRAHAAVFDAARDRLVISGGEVSGLPVEGSGALDDVWTLPMSDATPQWEQLRDASSPGPRRGQAAVFDLLHARLVEFGGDRCGDPYGCFPVDDTWERVPAGSSPWREVDAAGRPGPRTFAGAVYDADSARMVVFGGLAGGVIYSDVWALDLGTGRIGPAIASDPSEPVVSAMPPLEMQARSPGPAMRGGLLVDVSVREPVSARLELFTVSGRRVASRDIAQLGAERRTVTLTGPHELAPGVYLVRLTAAGHSISAKAVVIR